ncbi:DNA internalization-related competence protein ComEC/Rec2 [Stenotrophomonas aracearum]|jgi:competence protein ComEC|uniref:DNA internalization-related competence protein ComEC/Rec2 n=1 Tax=Stenotrophomonas aracearum TaxID=3003272 RepID=A0ABY9YH95_9GAMM|nr:DNA internalization-related competence protein ComEC/Rec2 [Stenotrophomonas sp. A5588]WNH50043.1 DNA internalization-related competence protein ComEC/Rec2 [Stenotrophomonas sp. A5588]
MSCVSQQSPRIFAAPLPIFGKAAAAALLCGACGVVFAPLLMPVVTAWCALCAGVLLWCSWGRGRWCGALLVGIGWTTVQAQAGLDIQLPAHATSREYTVQGRVVDLPQHGPRSTRFRIRVDDDPAQPTLLRGRELALAWYDATPTRAPAPRLAVQAGARWQFQARLRPPRGLRNPGGFDAERHALLQRLAGTGHVRAGRALGPPTGLPAWRERMAAAIAVQVPGPGARFVQALALGDTRALGQRDWDDLRALGLTHLIAISGFHVGLVAGFAAALASLVWRVLPVLGRYWPRPLAAASSAVVGAALYAAAAGFALPTVRTVLMIAVVALARCTRRPGTVGQSLALAALAVLLVDPLSLLAPGFWLSFAGVLWLVWCLPGRDLHWLRTFLAAQGVATLALLPLTVALFGQASRAGPLVNLLAIPWWSLVVVPLSLLGTGLEAVYEGAGRWPWRAAAACFEASWWLFGTVARQPWALWWAPLAGAGAVPAALLGVFWLLLPRAAGARFPALLLCLPLLWPARDRPAPGEVELLVMDVGQGLAVWVRTHRHRLLYDAGPAAEGGFDAGERVVVPTLHAVGEAGLDRVLLSHGDRDHAGGMPAVRLHFGTPPLHAPAGAVRADLTPCQAGDRWRWDQVDFTVLHPPAGMAYAGNASSCVLRIQTLHGAVLLTGDIGHAEEARLLAAAPGALRAEVALVAHHGSAGSSSPDWIQAVAPRLAIVSAGHGNRFGHPRREVVQRWRAASAEVLGTADSGALRIWLGRDGLQVREQRLFERRWWDAAERARSAAILSAVMNTVDGPEG